MLGVSVALATMAEGWESCSVSTSCPGGGSVGCSAAGDRASCSAGGGSVTCESTISCGPNCRERRTRTVTCGGGGNDHEPDQQDYNQQDP